MTKKVEAVLDGFGQWLLLILVIILTVDAPYWELSVDGLSSSKEESEPPSGKGPNQVLVKIASEWK